MVNLDVAIGRWKQLKGCLWALWAEYVDSDDAWVSGNHDFLAGVMQEYYGKEQDEVSSRHDRLH
ncbi:CsbD family protein [Dickeya oryzae]|uniref:CsbD family protein n=1 Tax=Dickeya oryzae TaxID=1240404 RepID=UPI001FED7C6C|nr:stress-response protein [Dickeya oryzae]